MQVERANVIENLTCDDLRELMKAEDEVYIVSINENYRTLQKYLDKWSVLLLNCSVNKLVDTTSKSISLVISLLLAAIKMWVF